MIFEQLDENIRRVKRAVALFENSLTYKAYRWLGGQGNYERDLRALQNESTNLRRQLHTDVQAIAYKLGDRDLIQAIDGGYFDKVADAISRETLLKVINIGKRGLGIPDTSKQLSAETQQIVAALNRIAAAIEAYNEQVAAFRQTHNKLYVTLYEVPEVSNLPEPIEGSVTLTSVLGIRVDGGRASLN